MASTATIFVSYSRQDKDFAQKFVAVLRQAGITVWLDQDMTAAEQNFQERITRAIKEQDAVVVLWSQHSVRSQWVQAEAELARVNKKLVQVRLDDCEVLLPFNIGQCEDFRDWDASSSAPVLRKLLDAIEALAATRRALLAALPDDPEMKATEQLLRDRLNIEIRERIATGEISTVYLGGDSWRQYSVKIIPNAQADENDIAREVLVTSQLYHPSFLRIVDVTFRKNECIVVSDYATGRKLSAMLADLQADVARGMRTSARFQPAVVVDVMRQLAEVLTEAHYRGLRYTRLSPREIYLVDDFMLEDAKPEPGSEEPRGRLRVLLSPINFAYRSELARSDHHLAFTADRGPFTAPEVLIQGSPLRQENWRPILQKADQFSLGMVAWTMLEGRLPFDVGTEQEGAFARTHRFVNAAQLFPQRVMAAEWRVDARALARIIARMLQPVPGDRWASMKEVSRLFAALDATQDSEYLRNIVKSMYASYCRGPGGAPNVAFYARFYERLFELAPGAQEVFAGRGIVDLASQIAKLDAALHQVLNFHQAQNEPTPLSRLVETHASLGLSDDMYRKFGEAMIETFAENIPTEDPGREMKAAALDVVIWPAVYYFIDRPSAMRKAGASHGGAPVAAR